MSNMLLNIILLLYVLIGLLFLRHLFVLVLFHNVHLAEVLVEVVVVYLSVASIIHVVTILVSEMRWSLKVASVLVIIQPKHSIWILEVSMVVPVVILVVVSWLKILLELIWHALHVLLKILIVWLAHVLLLIPWVLVLVHLLHLVLAHHRLILHTHRMTIEIWRLVLLVVISLVIVYLRSWIKLLLWPLLPETHVLLGLILVHTLVHHSGMVVVWLLKLLLLAHILILVIEMALAKLIHGFLIWREILNRILKYRLRLWCLGILLLLLWNLTLVQAHRLYISRGQVLHLVNRYSTLAIHPLTLDCMLILHLHYARNRIDVLIGHKAKSSRFLCPFVFQDNTVF